MSVSGEFRRILGDATASLRVDGGLEFADALERAGDASPQDLSVAANRVLAVLADRETACEATEHLEAICRAILGR
jgi:hypothetical protein